jgi:predicted HicB family RNase H-like nuclease
MPKSKKPVDTLPQSFKTIDEFIEFWDTHSTADYPEAFREIEESVRLRERQHYRVALDSRVGKKLAEQAEAKGVTLDKLVNQLLSAQLRHPS